MRFSKQELDLIDQLSQGKSAKAIAEKAGAKEETIRDRVDELKTKLGADTQDAVAERFADVTGWANRPKDYAPSDFED